MMFLFIHLLSYINEFLCFASKKSSLVTRDSKPCKNLTEFNGLQYSRRGPGTHVRNVCLVDLFQRRVRYKILCPIRYVSWESHSMVSATKSASYKIPHQIFHTNHIRYSQNLGSQRVSYKVSLLY